MLSTHLVIGEIVRPQGIRGEVKVRVITCDPDRYFDLSYVFFKKGEAYSKRNVTVSRVDVDAAYLTVEGVSDRNEAEKLRGELIYIDRANAVELSEDENFICDLIGCEGVDESGATYGTLDDVMQPGGNDVYVFHKDGHELLVPALKSVITRVDVNARKVYLSAARLREVAVFDED